MMNKSLSILGGGAASCLFLAFFVFLMRSAAKFAYVYLDYPPFYVLFCLCIVATALISALVLHRNKHCAPAAAPVPSAPLQKTQAKWGVLLALVAFLLTLGLSMLLSTAWLKGDDFSSLNFHQTPLISRFFRGIGWYSQIVSRNGDFLIRIFSFHESRWPLWTLHPLVVLLIPYGLLRLSGKGNEKLCSKQGVPFFVFSFLLALLSCRVIGGWRNYWCWAAGANYLWPSAAAIYLLSFFRKRFWVDVRSRSFAAAVKLALLFILGLYVLSGSECLTVALFPVLTLWLAYKLVKRERVAAGCLAAYLGSLWGSFLMFASPALQRKAEWAATLSVLDASTLSHGQMLEFVQNLTDEKIGLISCSSYILMNGFPLWARVYFLPYLAERYWESGMFVMGMLALLLIPLALQKTSGGHKPLRVVLALACLSLYSALAYLAGAIPSHMSFLPPCFILLVACSYAYWHIDTWGGYIRAIACGLVVAVAMWAFIPAGVEAWRYKRYEQTRFAYINEQKCKGVEDVRIPPLFPVAPKDKLGLIGGAGGGFSEYPDAFPNDQAAPYFGVKSVSQQQQ